MLAFDDDAEEFGLVQHPDRIECSDWSAEKDIDLPPRALPIIVGALTELDKQKKLTENHFSLYEKFVGEE